MFAANDNFGQREASPRAETGLRAVKVIRQSRPSITRRKANGYLPAWDDAYLATFGRDRRDLEREARRAILD